MSAADDVDQLIVKGNPLALQEALKKLFFQREEVRLNYPLSPPARGWEEVAAQFDTVPRRPRDVMRWWRPASRRPYVRLPAYRSGEPHLAGAFANPLQSETT